MFSQCRHIPGCWNKSGEYAHGANGFAELMRGNIKGQEKWRFRGRAANSYQVEHDVLFKAVRNGEDHNEAEYGALSTLTTIMGRMATYSGKQVKWEDALNSKLSLSPKLYDWNAEPPTLPDENGQYAIATPGVTKAW